jgi:hypothetical protein
MLLRMLNDPMLWFLPDIQGVTFPATTRSRLWQPRRGDRLGSSKAHQSDLFGFHPAISTEGTIALAEKWKLAEKIKTEAMLFPVDSLCSLRPSWSYRFAFLDANK